MLKNLKNNKKGFTLIELLAVIVILAILVMVAIPAITKYLDTSRRGAFADSINTAIDQARNDFIIGNNSGSKTYYTDDLAGTNGNKINDLLTKKISSSPFGGQYSGKITVEMTGDNTNDAKITITTCFVSKSGDTINGGMKAGAISKTTIEGDDVKQGSEGLCDPTS